jgi:hypothetical protein
MHCIARSKRTLLLLASLGVLLLVLMPTAAWAQEIADTAVATHPAVEHDARPFPPKVQNQIVWFAFLTGGFFSGLCGFLGMKTATLASNRTAAGARKSLNQGLTVAFRAAPSWAWSWSASA